MFEVFILPTFFLLAAVLTRATQNPALCASGFGLMTMFFRYGTQMVQQADVMANNNSLSISFSLFLVSLMDGMVVLFVSLPLLSWVDQCNRGRALEFLVAFAGAAVFFGGAWHFFPWFENYLLTHWLKETNLMR
jgi:hypothetical protein